MNGYGLKLPVRVGLRCPRRNGQTESASYSVESEGATRGRRRRTVCFATPESSASLPGTVLGNSPDPSGTSVY